MNALDYLEEKTVKVSDFEDGETLVVTEDDAYEAVDMAKREIAHSIREKYLHLPKKVRLYEIIRYCEGIIDF